MKTLLQINTVINSGSTGHIAENIGKVAISHDWKSYIAYGRNPRKSESIPIKIGTKISVFFHVFVTRLFDLHGFGSYFATVRLLRRIKKIHPDIIHLHNIHGYYIHIELLFKCLAKLNIPVVWTLHDCWAFTGHCSHYLAINCEKWKSQCFQCYEKNKYPKSICIDNSYLNYKKKKRCFTLLDSESLKIVTPSEWLSNELKVSFLSKYETIVINNGIDLDIFKPTENTIRQKYGSDNKKIILGVASVWSDRKGLDDFIKLADCLSDNFIIILIGLSKKQLTDLPSKIIGIKRTESQVELAQYYSAADVFFNPTYEDNFPTTNIEALACGTPVITYNTGGSPEIVDDKTGYVVPVGDLSTVITICKEIEKKDKRDFSEFCINRVKKYYDQNDCFEKYFRIYESMIKA